MEIKHKLLNEKNSLLPNGDIKYLFIGTFNPDLTGNNARWFYERKSNNFWPVIAQIFNNPLTYEEMNDPNKLKEYADKNGFGFTDLILSVESNANDLDFLKDILTYSDEKIVKYQINFYTGEILDYISQHKTNLEAVFITRKTFSKINAIEQEWKKIEIKCKELKIETAQLITPSSRGGGARQIYDDWKGKITCIGIKNMEKPEAVY